MVVEILETVKPEPAVIAACHALREKGYMLVLDDFSPQEGWEELADLASIIKVDFRATTKAEQQSVVKRYAPGGTCMLAEKIVLLPHQVGVADLFRAGGKVAVPKERHFFLQRSWALRHALQPPIFEFNNALALLFLLFLLELVFLFRVGVFPVPFGE